MEHTNYKTNQKKELMDFLEEHSDRHFTVDEIVSGIGGHGVAKSTVYRQISKLESEGIVRRFEVPGSNSFAFQFSGENDSCDCHFHLKCTKCGRLIHMECPQLTKVQQHIMDEHDFLIGSHRAVIYGECISCAGSNIKREKQ